LHTTVIPVIFSVSVFPGIRYSRYRYFSVGVVVLEDFLIPKILTEFSFGIGMVNTEKYRPIPTEKYRLGKQL